LILGPDGRRLSKRHGATAVGDYAKRGILPEAMFNFLAFLGWSPGDDREVFTREELVDAFSLERVLRKSSVFDVEKLQWLNGQHLMRTPTEALVVPVEERLREQGVPVAGDDIADPIDLSFLVDLLKPRSRTVEELVGQAAPYFKAEVVYDPNAVKKNWTKDLESVTERLARVREALESCSWEEAPLEETLRGLAEGMEVGAGKIFQPLRVALTGSAASPGIFDVLLLLGRNRSLSRLDQALDHIKAGTLLEGE